MKLERIFLHGFKSFAKPTKIPVANGVTAIVGPNGGGKSNIVDAIRWVFGEQSMKELRAGEKYDVIFAGSGAAVSSAYVELNFRNAKESISVSRLLTSDGKNFYKMNGENVRLRDIQEKFAGTGTGREFYSIVGQGQIQKITSSSPQELRFLLEEAAETSFYRKRKKEALTRLENVEMNLTRVQDVLTELEKQRKSLYLKAKRAERYKEYSERLSRVKSVYYGNILRRENERLKHLEEQHQATSEKIRKIQKELISVESKWSSLKQEFAMVDKEIENFTNVIEDYKKRQSTLLELREMYSRRLSDRESKYVELTTRLDSFKEQLEQLQKRKDELDLIFRALVDEISLKEEDLSQLEKRREEMFSRYSEKEKELLAMKEERDKLHSSLTRAESEIEHMEDSLEDFKKRISMVESQLDMKMRRLLGLENELTQLVEKMKDSGEKESNLAKELEKIKERQSDLERERRITVEQRDNAIRVLKQLDDEEKRIKWRIQNYEGYTRAVRAVFAKKKEGFFPGVHDVVANLISSPPKYARAIEVLLGGAAQHIVTDNTDTAKNVISWLFQEKIGRATFLPLDLIESYFSEIRDLKGHPGFVGYAATLVRVEKQYGNLPVYLFGNDLVVRTLDDAVKIKKKFRVRSRIATLSGEIVGSRGSITGGQSKIENSDSFLGRKMKLIEITSKRKEMLNLSQIQEKNLKRIDEEIHALRNHERLVERELTQVLAEGSSVRRMAEELNKTVTELRTEIESLEKLKDSYSLKISGMQSRRERLLSKINEEREKISKLEENMKEFDQDLLMRKEELEEVSSAASDLKVELSNLLERKTHYEAELSRVKSSQKSIEQERDTVTVQVEQMEDELSRLRNAVLENQREMEALKRETETLFENMRIQRADKEQKLSQLGSFESKMEQLKEEREKLRDYSHHLELSIQETRGKIERILDEIDGTSVEEVKEVDSETLEKFKLEIEDLENKMRYLGPVDMTVVGEYKEVDSRFNELELQKRDLQEAKRKIEKLIEKTDEEARNRFLDIYEQVNTKFNSFISMLFPGGTGEIRIEAGRDLLESGVEISVRKPNKRIQKLQLLSGGEKALVGIALLFALLEVRPSPFYVLDEVDAALDEFNAERFKRLIEKETERSQFIIITHNKVVMECADILHGVTMVDGISTIVPVRLEEFALEDE